ncbi:hypothetical protein F2981_32790 (plasmid) [Sinorhizobium meliloti]|nr:hypothetical protein [Sinorhizobium meliloti]
MTTTRGSAFAGDQPAACRRFPTPTIPSATSRISRYGAADHHLCRRVVKPEMDYQYDSLIG